MHIRRLAACMGICLGLFTTSANAQNFGGTWDTTYGQIKLRETPEASGDSFLCGYYAQSGLVMGRAHRGRARGVFLHADQTTGAAKTGRTNVLGTFDWKLESANRFAGHWRWTISPTQPGDDGWNGTRRDATQASGFTAQVEGVCETLAQVPALAAWFDELDQLSPAPVFTARYPDSDLLLSDVARRENLDALGRCQMDLNADFNLSCTLASGESGSLDLRNCVPGSLRRGSGDLAQAPFLCDGAIYGSFLRSCSAPIAKAAPVRTGTTGSGHRVLTTCQGPKIARLQAMNFPKLVNNSTQLTYYSPTEKGYVNSVAAVTCPSRSYWNENGILRCSGQ